MLEMDRYGFEIWNLWTYEIGGINEIELPWVAYRGGTGTEQLLQAKEIWRRIMNKDLWESNYREGEIRQSYKELISHKNLYRKVGSKYKERWDWDEEEARINREPIHRIKCKLCKYNIPSFFVIKSRYIKGFDGKQYIQAKSLPGYHYLQLHFSAKHPEEWNKVQEWLEKQPAREGYRDE